MAIISGDNFNPFLVGIQMTGSDNRSILTYTNFNVPEKTSPKVSIDYSDYYSDAILQTDTLTQEAQLNFKKDWLNPIRYINFGSTKDFFRVSFQNILKKFPASLFVNPFTDITQYYTIEDYSYNSNTDISTFKVNSQRIINDFSLIYSIDIYNNESSTIDVSKNLIDSFQNYVISINNIDFKILSFTPPLREKTGYLNFTVKGRIFETPSTNYSLFYHIKPDISLYTQQYNKLEEFEKYILENKTNDGYVFNINVPLQTDTNTLIIEEQSFTWLTTDGYNIDINTNLFEIFDTVGEQYDSLKTDLIYRYLTPNSIKEYDLTDDKNIDKLLRIYGKSYDDIRNIIDNFNKIYQLNYDKKNQTADELIYRLISNLSIQPYEFINDENVLNLISKNNEFNNINLKLPPKINIQIWKNILINLTNLFKSKGTRQPIEFIFNLLGFNQFNYVIDEFVYITEQNFRVKTSNLVKDNKFPNFNNSTLKFQQALYFKEYEDIGFSFSKTVDNTKVRLRDEFSDGIVNTKYLIYGIDTAKNIEYDIYCFNNIDLNFSAGTTSLGDFLQNPSINEDDFPEIFTGHTAYTFPLVTKFDSYIYQFWGSYYPKFENNFFKRNTLSFSDYINKTFTYFINARNRKVIVEYPTLKKLYIEYLKNWCSKEEPQFLLQENEELILQENGFPILLETQDGASRFVMEESYLNNIFLKYYRSSDCYNIYKQGTATTYCIETSQLGINQYFKYLEKININVYDLIDQFIPMTAIKASGHIVRNVFYTSQKFIYKRGINESSEFVVDIDSFNNNVINANQLTISPIVETNFDLIENLLIIESTGVETFNIVFNSLTIDDIIVEINGANRATYSTLQTITLTLNPLIVNVITFRFIDNIQNITDIICENNGVINTVDLSMFDNEEYLFSFLDVSNNQINQILGSFDKDLFRIDIKDAFDNQTSEISFINSLSTNNFNNKELYFGAPTVDYDDYITEPYYLAIQQAINNGWSTDLVIIYTNLNI